MRRRSTYAPLPRPTARERVLFQWLFIGLMAFVASGLSAVLLSILLGGVREH